MTEADPHRLSLKIYLEDTDAQGIVYHANYLKFFERARTDIMADLGGTPLGYGELKLRFVVHEVHVKFHRPGLLGDTVEVVSSAKRESNFRIGFSQAVFRASESKPLVDAKVQVVCIDEQGGLAQLPEGFLGPPPSF